MFGVARILASFNDTFVYAPGFGGCTSRAAARSPQPHVARPHGSHEPCRAAGVCLTAARAVAGPPRRSALREGLGLASDRRLRASAPPARWLTRLRGARAPQAHH